MYILPKHLDEKVARLHLQSLGVELTSLSKEQADYIGVPVEGEFTVIECFLPVDVNDITSAPSQDLSSRLTTFTNSAASLGSLSAQSCLAVYLIVIL